MDDILLNIFFAYSREDAKLRERLDKHLSGLKRRNFINTWYDGKIDAGTEWEKEIDFNLSKADIILLLISVDFIASDYCFEKEMKKAISRHEKGDAVIIPILLNPCDWSDLPFSKIQGLPQNGKPVTSTDWESVEIALNEVANSIKSIVENLRASKSKHLKSINEVLKEKDSELRITLEQLEELQIEQEIKNENIENQKVEIKLLNDNILNFTSALKELENSYNFTKLEYDKKIKSLQIDVNKLKHIIEQMKIEIETKENIIQKLEKKKGIIEAQPPYWQ